MDHRIEELIQFTKEKFCLHEYDLHTFAIERSATIFKETVYRLSMEWFPIQYKNWNDETSHPEGTAYIEIDIHSRQTKSVIFSGGKSYVDRMTFDWNNKDEIVKWIEQETGLRYEKQFILWKEEERRLYFKECIDGVAVSPSGSIELRLDEDGRLTMFSVIGQFSTEKRIKKERFLLSYKQIEALCKEQLKFVELPVIEQKKIVPVFAIEEIYVQNDGSSTLPFEFFVNDKFPLPIDKVMEWTDPIPKPFHGKEITFEERVAPEQAFRSEPHPDLRAITGDETEKCVNAIETFLRQAYANDSGKWVLKSLYRDQGYIHATLRPKEQTKRVFERKMMLFIDSETYDVLNYIDNHPMVEEMYAELKKAEEMMVTKEEAFEQLKDLMELTPYYVYDVEQDCYVLCGKVDCQYAVNANNGEVVDLNEW